MTFRSASLALSIVWLTACGSHPLRWDAPDSYAVKPGDTLVAIAWRYELDYRDLARWNGLGDGNHIRVGQRLRLTAPARKPRQSSAVSKRGSGAGETRSPPTPPPTGVAPEKRVHWQWPADGVIIAGFGDAGSIGKGLDIGGDRGGPVRAAGTGRVVYTGSGLIGFGQLIILKHNNRLLSAYGHNNAVLVKEGDDVSAGQRIATMGEGPGKTAMLHFEIRENGVPVDPKKYLPPR